MYRIKDWDEHFETHKTRILKRLDWVPVPNKMDGDGYTELVDHPDGAAHLGVWLALLLIASKADPRGTLVRSGGQAHDTASLARMTRLQSAVIAPALRRLIDIGWVIDNEIKDMALSGENPALSGATRHFFPSLPFSSLPDFESKKKTFLADESIFPDWWQMWSKVRGTHHDREALQAWLSVVPMDLEGAAVECTASYLSSLDNTAKGFNPDNFLFEQAKNQFRARWPAFARNGAARETRAQRLAREMDAESGEVA